MALDQEFANPDRRSPLTAWELGVWLLLAAASWYSLTAYGFKSEGAGDRASAPTVWPAGSTLDRQPGRQQLLVFLHPKCPCSFATVGELQRVLEGAANDGGRLPQIWVVACVPADGESSEEWQGTRLLRKATAVPQSQVHYDKGGIEAKRFAAETSGTVLLFDENGRRLYRGGVTAARGHEGDNVGAASLARLLNGAGGLVTELPPLGCRLVGAADECLVQCTKLAQGSIKP